MSLAPGTVLAKKDSGYHYKVVGPCPWYPEVYCVVSSRFGNATVYKWAELPKYFYKQKGTTRTEELSRARDDEG